MAASRVRTVVAIAGVLFVVSASCGATDREVVAEPSAAPTTVSPTTAGTTTLVPSDRIVPGWQLSHLSSDELTVAVTAYMPCGAEYDDFELSVDESPDEVSLLVTAVEVVPPDGCEAADSPVPLEVSLAAPLADRTIVDAADPQRDLGWAVQPETVEGWVTIESEPGAVDASLSDGLLVGLGVDGYVTPFRISQLRSGIGTPIRFTIAPGGEHVIMFGIVPSLPLDPATVVDQGSLPVPAPEADPAIQHFIVTLHAGAIRPDGTSLTVDLSKVSLSWQPTK